MCEGDVGAAGGVGGLLEEDGVAGYFADVDGDCEALACFEKRGREGVSWGFAGGVGGMGLRFLGRRGGGFKGGELTGEDCVHDGDVLVREVAGDGEDEDPRVQGCGLG